MTAALPHSHIREVFKDIFFVTGTNIVDDNGMTLQHSRNMVIVREGNKLSLINTVRLTESGLSELEALGQIENVIRIGAFHGRDDAFYVERYHARLWALDGMQDQHGVEKDATLKEGGPMPFGGCAFFNFTTSRYPEGVLHLSEKALLITCDSIKNWVEPDAYFDEPTAENYNEQGFFGKASIAKVWQDACCVDPSDFVRLKALSFSHLISAHGEPLIDTAYQDVVGSIEKAYVV